MSTEEQDTEDTVEDLQARIAELEGALQKRPSRDLVAELEGLRNEVTDLRKELRASGADRAEPADVDEALEHAREDGDLDRAIHLKLEKMRRRGPANGSTGGWL